MLNYIRADLYRMFSSVKFLIWALAFAGIIPLFALAASSAYSMEQVAIGTTTAISILFLFAALVIGEYTFREDKQLGVFKNDTTSGVSRFQIFIAKYAASAMLMVLLWLFCSALTAAAITKGFGVENMTGIIRAVFSLRTASGLLNNLMYLALFQLISIFVKKTTALLWVCLAISTALGRIGDIIPPLVPKLKTLFEMAFGQGALDNIVVQGAVTLMLPLAGTIIFLLIGCALFQKSEF